MKTQIISLIQQSADGVSEQLIMEMQEKGEDTILFGPQGLLDSLGLVNLIVSLESAIDDEFGIAIVLADERAMSQARNPFRTVGTLVDYTLMLVKEANGDSLK